MVKPLKTNASRLLGLWALCLAQPSYSEYEFGYSNNAALGGSSWSMSHTLFGVPSMAAMDGVDVSGVYYTYRAVKDAGDPFTVSVQNQNSDGSGYIFRSVDDWSGGSGGTIIKFVPVPYSPVGDWGDGSIEQVGIGSVEDPTVLYSYRHDPDRVQQFDTELQEAYDFSTISAYDPLSDRYVLNALEPTDPELYEDKLEKGKDEEEDDGRLEKALAAQDNALTLASSMTQNALLKAMNTATNLNSYYAARLQGGQYQETVVLKDKNIPDNRRAFRSMSQQKLHTQMVDSQY